MRRIEGIDVARALASLIMIQGHAYHGWVAEPFRESGSYQFTRLLGTLPLPSFLVLAGAALMLRVHVAAERGESAAALRQGLVRRGLTVIGWGYAVSFAYAVMDGARDLETLLRADVLHVIGLSIALVGAWGIRATPSGVPDRRALMVRSAALGAVLVAACPWLSPLGAEVPAGLRYVAALFVDVPGVTRMPAVPLLGWLTLGLVAMRALLRTQRAGDRYGQVAGASAGALWSTLAGSLVLSVACHYGTEAWVAHSGQTLSRAHPAVWLNALDLGARGMVVLSAGALLSVHLPARMRTRAAQLGRGTLLMYVLHVPFCYGALGRSAYHALDMAQATLWIVPLMVGCAAAVMLRDWAKAARPDYVKSRAPAGS